jgi:hypothetical protein
MRNRSQSLTSTTTWSLIVIAICACCAAVVSLRQSMVKEKTRRSPDSNEPQSGHRPTVSSKVERSGLRIIYRPGSDTTYKRP